MNRLVLDNAQARRIFLDRHALSEAPQGDARGPALLGLIERLGFVQLDSINTLARAHDLILFSRRPRYRPKALKTLYEKDRALFEHWTHDAAVIPMGYYPYWHLRRQRDADRLRERWRDWRRDGFEARFQTVLDQIRDHGPVSSSEVGTGEARGSGGWWDWHPSKTALEYLWRSGALCVVGREGFQKRYDLTERVLEQSVCDPARAPDHRTTVNWCCSGALDRLGFATPGELAAFWDHVTMTEAKAWCTSEQAAGRLQPVTIIGADGTPRDSFARPEIAADPALEIAPTKRLRVLSPFDPALRDRKRAERLFGFDYRIEVFVPAAKRTYGYYVFPVLEGDRLVARVDMKAFRDRDTLQVRALWPEPRVRWSKGRAAAFEAEVQRLTKLAGVSQVAFDNGWLRAD
ncbi:winged helix-turn-helix domain-containing protein [Sulfitobacter sabulilitoris]|uniref:Winged helix-turn-helix domain-containing protein n=1 Tax=Sulfitobacter sabulilitoris TaxID=2562655 RepID=A0A5S3Q7B8_9RHOB|nr:crosslink repair DNA glycosylase YcaQ family protein [Sulfitobacter sabulilitoris]TMM52743.1 winged helix-turn-helix domain-containing protein [Sulfitobacter sabulilitoris]